MQVLSQQEENGFTFEPTLTIYMTVIYLLL